MLKVAPRTKSQGITKLTADVPGGLSPMELDPEDFALMPEAQHLHIAFEDENLGLSVGVWDTTTMQESFGPYPGDEFIVVLDGDFRMMDTADDTGSSVHGKEGDCVIFRNGAPVSWKQEGYLKKFFMLYLDPRAAEPQGISAVDAIQALDPQMTLTDDDLDKTASVKQRDKCVYTNDHGNFTAGLWDTEAMDTPMEAFPWHEFAYVREGEVTITEETGEDHIFGPGDTFFVPAGTVCRWVVPKYLRKFYAALDPAIRPRGAS